LNISSLWLENANSGAFWGDIGQQCPFAITSLIECEITKAEMTHFQRHWLFVNMPFTKEDKILIKNLYELKCYNARHLVKEFPTK